jgi:lysophospholipase L1-like esterase
MSFYPEFRQEPSKLHQCVHVDSDGNRCVSHAMRNQYTCYHHQSDQIPSVFPNVPFPLDRVDDRTSIQKAVGDVLAQLAANEMDVKRASVLLYGLQLAASNLPPHPRPARQPASQSVPQAADPHSHAEAQDQSPAPPEREYTREETIYFDHTVTALGFEPNGRPRPTSVTDDDILNRTNEYRLRCYLRMLKAKRDPSGALIAVHERPHTPAAQIPPPATLFTLNAAAEAFPSPQSVIPRVAGEAVRACRRTCGCLYPQAGRPKPNMIGQLQRSKLIPEGQTMKLCHSRLFLLALLAAGAIAAPAVAQSTSPPAPPIKIVLVGDSTVATGGGWGPGFCAVVTPNVTCIDEALNGRSSKSYIDEGAWKKALAEHGNYYLIQFGHNDQKTDEKRHTDAEGSFKDYLQRYVSDVQAMGAVPVLVTSLSRRTFKDGKVVEDLKDYATATRELAATDHIAVIDLNALSTAMLNRMGQDEADKFDALLHPDATAENPTAGKTTLDRTHLNPYGQKVFGRIVADQLARTQVELAPDVIAEPAKAAAK